MPSNQSDNNTHNGSDNDKPTDNNNSAGQKNNHLTIIIVAATVGVGVALFIFLASLLWWRYHQRSKRRQPQGSSRGDIDKDTPIKAAEGTNIGGFNLSHERPSPSHPRMLPWNAPIPTPFTKHSAYDGSTSPLLSRA